MTYKNPILYADYSDPDVLRVGEDFYMISSSFTYLPGVPLLHSRDLVHWELINYCVPALPFEKYDRPSHGSGTWAPSLRYHDGMFIAFVPLVDEGILVARSRDPYGEFELNLLCEAKGWEDPCPLWDDDGRAYMVFAYAKSRAGIRDKLAVVEIDPDCRRLLGTPRVIFEGVQIAPGTEGPKFYKRDGEYLILAPSGGVAVGWQSAFRSGSVWGPYEYKIVMHQGASAVNGPHQGGWVTAPDGRDWFVHFQDVGELGRITHLQPMCFLSGWPFIGQDIDADGIGEPVGEWPLPVEGAPAYEIAQSDDFASGRPGLQWQWQANPKERYFAPERREGALRLACLSNDRRENLLWYAPNVLTQIPQHPSLRAQVRVALSEDGRPGDMASIGVLGHSYGCLGLRRTETGFALSLIRGEVTKIMFEGEAEERLAAEQAVKSPAVVLRAEIFPDKTYGFAWSEDGERFRPIGGRYPLTRATWTGAKLCLWACNRENRPSEGFGEFSHMDIRGTEGA